MFLRNWGQNDVELSQNLEPAECMEIAKTVTLNQPITVVARSKA
jgi:hypothetical protein